MSVMLRLRKPGLVALEAVITKQFHPLSGDPGGIVSFLGIKAFKEQMSKLEVLEAKLPVGLFKADTERNCFCSFFFFFFFFSFMYSGYGENSI